MSVQIIEAKIHITRVPERTPGDRYDVEARFKLYNSGSVAVGPLYAQLAKNEAGASGNSGGYNQYPLVINSIAPNTTTNELSAIFDVQSGTVNIHGNPFQGKWNINITDQGQSGGNIISGTGFTLTGTDPGGGPVRGCTDETAINHNRFALESDGNCYYEIVYGCTDPNASNYNPNATHDNGSCEYAPQVQTGYLHWSELEEYDILNFAPTGNTKPNVPTDEDYVPPIYNPDTCPVG